MSSFQNILAHTAPHRHALVDFANSTYDYVMSIPGSYDEGTYEFFRTITRDDYASLFVRPIDIRKDSYDDLTEGALDCAMILAVERDAPASIGLTYCILCWYWLMSTSHWNSANQEGMSEVCILLALETREQPRDFLLSMVQVLVEGLFLNKNAQNTAATQLIVPCIGVLLLGMDDYRSYRLSTEQMSRLISELHHHRFSSYFGCLGRGPVDRLSARLDSLLK